MRLLPRCPRLADSRWPSRRPPRPRRKTNVAHRGASAYAPEHTLAAYRLALEQGADFVEQDLAVTRDGVLICLHDPSLERTTNVEELFPSRSTEIEDEGKKRRAWLANDFTLEEIKRLDAGSWFDPKFAGERVPTFDEAVALIKGKAGLFPELKTPEIYKGRDVRFEALVAAALDKHGLRGPHANAASPVILQTFGEDSARKLAGMKIGVPVVLLSIARRLGPRGSWKGVVQGSAREGHRAQAAVRALAHAAGLTVTRHIPFGSPAVPDREAEMEHYLTRSGWTPSSPTTPTCFRGAERAAAVSIWRLMIDDRVIHRVIGNCALRHSIDQSIE